MAVTASVERTHPAVVMVSVAMPKVAAKLARPAADEEGGHVLLHRRRLSEIHRPTALQFSNSKGKMRRVSFTVVCKFKFMKTNPGPFKSGHLNFRF
jgi:hypothetical protein